ncbi:MAG: DegV family protein, partial [Anaerolineae bacterium]
MPDVAIVTDTVSDIPPNLAEEFGLIVAPVHVVIDGKDHRDQIDITVDQYYPMLEVAAEKGELPTTSGANVSDMREIFEEALNVAPVVVGVMVAQPISVTITSARTAKQEFFPEAPIHILDSQQVVAGQALLAIAAGKAAQEGHSADDIIAMMERLIPNTKTLLTVESLKFFAAGGRLTATEQLLGSLEGYVPILQAAGGRIIPIEKRRTRRQAVNRMLAIMEEDVGDGLINVCVNHARRPSDAGDLLEEIKSRFNVQDSYIIEIGPATGTHTGPGSLGFGYCPA